jgi:hypothetical protein
MKDGCMNLKAVLMGSRLFHGMGKSKNGLSVTWHTAKSLYDAEPQRLPEPSSVQTS